jgi:hypothetical protein
MKNQTPMQTEPGRDVITPGACEILAKRPGPVRLAAPVKRKPLPAWLDGWETRPKVSEGLRGVQIQSNTAMNGTNSLAEWCRQLPALRLESEAAPSFPGGKDGWPLKNKQGKKQL